MNNRKANYAVDCCSELRNLRLSFPGLKEGRQLNQA